MVWDQYYVAMGRGEVYRYGYYLEDLLNGDDWFSHNHVVFQLAAHTYNHGCVSDVM